MKKNSKKLPAWLKEIKKHWLIVTILLVIPLGYLVYTAFTLLETKKKVQPKPIQKHFAASKPIMKIALSPTLTATTTKPIVSPPVTTSTEVLSVPILMFHHVSNQPDYKNHFWFSLNVTPQKFDTDMRYLADNGYTTIGLGDLYHGLFNSKPLPPKSVIITFDDGYDDNYTQAYQILKKYNMRGTFFVISSFISKPGYMTSGQIKEMADAGMEMESHAANHWKLASLNSQTLASELTNSKSTLEKILGKEVDFLAYPMGSYNPTVIQIAAKSYLMAVTTERGFRQERRQPFELKRLYVGNAYNLGALLANLR